jgi:uncharacterized protein
MPTVTAISTSHLRIHRFTALRPGPKLIVTGAVHGNETAGTRGIEQVLDELARREFDIVRGQVSFVPVCNPLAYTQGARMGQRNLNRGLSPTASPQQFEDHIANVLCPLLAEHDALLDLHSFRSPGQPFVLRGPRNNSGTLEPFARQAEEDALVAHLGVQRVVEGWLAVYAEGVAQRQARAPAGADINPRYGVGTTEYMRSVGGYAVTLECGQHDDPAGPAVAHHAIRQTLALLGLTEGLALGVPRGPVEVLRLERVVDRLSAGDALARPWTSFDAVAEGELIATRADGSELRALKAGRIVFPDPNAAAGHEWFYFAQPSDRPVA